MYEAQNSRRTVSLVLVLALSVWVQVSPLMAETPQHACHMGMKHSQPIQSNANIGAHRCCPGEHAASNPVAHFLTDGTLCHQDCCSLRQQPERGLPFVANAGGATSVDGEAQTTEATVLPIRPLDAKPPYFLPFARAVLDLKADLRI